jgi:membrane protease YdiL (CAAX protease family)
LKSGEVLLFQQINTSNKFITLSIFAKCRGSGVKALSLSKRANRIVGILLVIIIIDSLVMHLGWLFGVDSLVNMVRYLNVIILYICILILLWFSRDNLEQYHMDRAAIIALILTGIFRSRLNEPYDLIMRLILIVLTVIIVLLAIKSWQYIPVNKWAWVGIAILSGVAVIPLAVVESLQPDRYLSITIGPGLGVFIVRRILFYLSFVAVFEEMAFRGILWGFLRGIGLKDGKIFWVQALLFWLGHLYRVINPITFFITIPVATIIYSLLAYRSRQVFPSIVSHTIVDTFGPLLTYYLIQ